MSRDHPSDSGGQLIAGLGVYGELSCFDVHTDPLHSVVAGLVARGRLLQVLLVTDGLMDNLHEAEIIPCVACMCPTAARPGRARPAQAAV